MRKATTRACEPVFVNQADVSDPIRVRLAAALAAARRRISELVAQLEAAQPDPGRARRDFRFRTLFTSNILGINLADSGGRVFLANDCFLARVGYQRADLPLDWAAMTPAEWRAADRSKAEEFAVTGIARPWEKELQHKDGHRVPVLMAVARLEVGDHECLAVVRDLTETKRAQARLRELSTQVALSEERERRRIALGLHDEVGQTLATAQMAAAKLRRLLADGEAVGLVDEIYALLGRSIDSTRSLTFELSSPVLRELGLEAAIEDCAQRVAGAHDLELRFLRRGAGRAPTGEDTFFLYRAVRELLHNVVKHARARTVHVTLRASPGGGVDILVEDDGIGFDASDWVGTSADRGFGLLSVREQVGQLGYRFEIESAAGRGTRAALLAPPRRAPAPAPAGDAVGKGPAFGHGAVFAFEGDRAADESDVDRHREPRR